MERVRERCARLRLAVNNTVSLYFYPHMPFPCTYHCTIIMTTATRSKPSETAEISNEIQPELSTVAKFQPKPSTESYGQPELSPRRVSMPRLSLTDPTSEVWLSTTYMCSDETLDHHFLIMYDYYTFAVSRPLYDLSYLTVAVPDHESRPVPLYMYSATDSSNEATHSLVPWSVVTGHLPEALISRQQLQ